MRALLFSDLHTDVRAAMAIAARAADADAVLGAGDYATVHRGMEPVLAALSEIRTPTVLVPGNNERPDTLRKAVSELGWKTCRVLHGEGCEIGGLPVFGLGAGVPITPFGDWSYDLSEDEAKAMLGPCPAGAVLISHSPPKGHGDRTSGGDSVGSEAVLEIIREKKPRLVVCGHIHDSWGYDGMEGPTRIINAGPEGVVVDLDEGHSGGAAQDAAP